MEIVELTAEARTEVGKKGSKAIRNAKMIPCVIYGGDKVVHFSTTLNDIRGLVYTPEFKVAMVTVGSESFRCIVKDVQFHPLTDDILHMDFLQLVDGKSVKVEVPVRFTGTSPGIKSGGSLVQKLRRVKIKTVPEKLVDQLTLDISNLELGHSIRVRDIESLEGVEILNPPANPVASVEIPRALRSATAAEEALEGEGEGEGEAAAEE